MNACFSGHSFVSYIKLHSPTLISNCDLTSKWCAGISAANSLPTWSSQQESILKSALWPSTQYRPCLPGLAVQLSQPCTLTSYSLGFSSHQLRSASTVTAERGASSSANMPADEPHEGQSEGMAAGEKQPIILLSCGSFNPPTVMHLRMFDLARYALQEVNIPDG